MTSLTLIAISLTVQPVSASPITCSQAALNAAIVASNASYAPIELPSGCTITLDGTLNSGSVYDGPGPTALAPITGTVTIFTASGQTPATITRDGSAPPFRIFSVQGGTLTLANLVVSGGLAKGGNGGDGNTNAGAGGGGGMGGNGGNGNTYLGAGSRLDHEFYGGGGGGSIGNGGDGTDTSGGPGGTGFDDNGTDGDGADAVGHNGGGGGYGATDVNNVSVYGRGGFGGGGGGTGYGGFGGGSGGQTRGNGQVFNRPGFGGGFGGLTAWDDGPGGGGGGGGAGLGGAIFVYSGSVNVFQTTFSNNKAVGGNGGHGAGAEGTSGDGGSAYGGAIFSGSVYCDGGTNTFSGNSALGGVPGPTLFNVIPKHGTPETETASDRFDNPGSNGLTAGTTTSDCTAPNVLAPDPLPHGAVGNLYDQTLTIGGVPPYHFEITTGALPDTLTLNSSTGEISGTPTEKAVIPFTVTITDFFNHTATKDYTLTIDDIAVNPPSLPIARLGKTYSQIISASGGTAPYTLSTSDTPPPGLTFDPASGLLSGIPTALGKYPFTVQAEDDNGLTGSQTYLIQVKPPLTEDEADDSGDDTPNPAPSGGLCASPDGVNAVVKATIPDGAASLDGHAASVYCSPLTVPDQYGGPFDQPVLHAVEVFALTDAQPSQSVTTFGAPVTICLQGSGRLLFRDANSGGQGRTAVELPSFAQGGFTCASVPNAGTVILLGGPSSLPPASPPETSGALSTCTVTTTARLNLRAAPDLSGDVLDLVPYQTSLKATARQGDFVQVVFGSQQGWLNTQYLTLDGDCES